MTDPREDALAKAREAIVYADECFEAALAEGLRDALADNDGERVHDLWSRRLSFARDKFPEALAALPAPSEPIDERLAASAVTFAAALAKNSGSPARVVSDNVRECMDDLGVTPRRIEAAEDDQLVEAMCAASYKTGAFVSYEAMRAALAVAVARKALTHSPTPYVRPAAEIRAEIERAKAAPSHIRTDAEKAGNRGYLSGLTFALTPPTQEPR